MTIRVALADDQGLVRAGFRLIIQTQLEMEVVGEAGDGLEAVALVERKHPDVMLMDIRMPEMDGLEAARRIRQQHPSVGVIMLTAYDDRQFVVEAVRAGARGYVLKARDAEHLIRAKFLEPVAGQP